MTRISSKALTVFLSLSIIYVIIMPIVAFANPGDVALHWTAPGDDGNIGTAHDYVIKYSLNVINESNWASATPVSNPPTPLPDGSPQSFTITGLSRGQQYYIGIKTCDEASNTSLLSNVLHKFASGIITPAIARSQVDTSANAVLYARTVQSYLQIYYQFVIDTNRVFPAPTVAADTVVDSLASVTFRNLRRNDWYYWRVRAMALNRTDSSLWSNTDSFFVAAANDNPPTAAVTAPNGGEIWVVGSVQNITWTDADDHGVTAYKLEYSIDAGTTWALIRDWTSGDPHSFAWTVPNAVSTSARVRVSCRDISNNVVSDISNANFTIRGNVAPSVTVTSPNGRERWTGGSAHNITWNDSDDQGVTAFKLEYSTNSGSTWILVLDWTSGDPHSFAWTVPNISSKNCRVRVSGRDGSGNIGTDISDANFTIQRGGHLLALTSPVDTPASDSTIETDTAFPSDSELTSNPSGRISGIGQMPDVYYLAQSYPNPFNAATTIEYGLPADDHVSISIYDMLGRKVKILVDEDQQAGSHRVTWNATGVASGTYLYVIQTTKFRETKRMQYLK